MRLYQRDWDLALAHAEAALATAQQHDSALLAAECAGIAARALKVLADGGFGRAAGRGCSGLQASWGQLHVLERLERDLEGLGGRGESCHGTA